MPLRLSAEESARTRARRREPVEGLKSPSIDFRPSGTRSKARSALFVRRTAADSPGFQPRVVCGQVRPAARSRASSRRGRRTGQVKRAAARAPSCEPPRHRPPAAARPSSTAAVKTPLRRSSELCSEEMGQVDSVVADEGNLGKERVVEARHADEQPRRVGGIETFGNADVRGYRGRGLAWHRRSSLLARHGSCGRATVFCLHGASSASGLQGD